MMASPAHVTTVNRLRLFALASLLCSSADRVAAQVLDFFSLPPSTETPLEHFLVTGRVEPATQVTLNGAPLPLQAVGGKQFFSHVVPLGAGDNTFTVAVESEEGALLSEVSKEVTRVPAMEVGGKQLLLADVTAGGSAIGFDGTAVLDVSGDAVLGVLPASHVRGVSSDFGEFYFANGEVRSGSTLDMIRTLPFSEAIPHNGFVVTPATLYSRSERIDVATNQLLDLLPFDITTGNGFSGRRVSGGPGVSADGALVCGGRDLACVDTTTNEVVAEGVDAHPFVSDVAVDAEAGLMFVAGYGGAISGQVNVYDLETRELVAQTSRHGDFAGEFGQVSDELFVFGNSGNPMFEGGGVSLYRIHSDVACCDFSLEFLQHEPVPFADNLTVWGNRVFVSSGGVSAGGDRFGVDVLLVNMDDSLTVEKSFFLAANVEGDEVAKIVYKPAVPTVPGDYNGDDVVNALDYVVWRDTLGSRSDLRADGELDGRIDSLDYAIWSSNYSNPNPAGAVPEAATVVVLLCASVILVVAPSRRRRLASPTAAGVCRATAKAIALLSGAAGICRAENGALSYLSSVQDEFHREVGVYEDVDAAGNHFFAVQHLPDEHAPVNVRLDSVAPPDGGATSLRVGADLLPGQFAGVVLQNGVLTDNMTEPALDFGETPNAGVDLRGATKLTFRARKIGGNGHAKVFVGGVGHNTNNPHKDSLEEVSAFYQFSDVWGDFELAIPSGRDLSSVRGGFGVAAGYLENPGGFVFEFDDIAWQLSGAAQAERLEEPRFLRSYRTRPVQPDAFDDNPLDDFDLVLRNAASMYDNAVAGLAWLAEGSPESLRRARIVADAYVYATTHDRFFTDGRVRTFLRAGDISLPPGWTPNGLTGTSPIPGFSRDSDDGYCDPGSMSQFCEIEQEASDVGANVWSSLFLLRAYEALGDEAYLDAGIRIADFVRTFRSMEGTYPGFLGGVDNPESESPTTRPWSSTEHNIDIMALARVGFELTGDEVWLEDYGHAKRFVESMWDESIGLYRAGTLDSDTRNELDGQLPADVNTWAILADPTVLQRHPNLLDNVISRFGTTDGDLTGVDFNDDLDGVQLEQTAILVTALQTAGRYDEAAYYLNNVLRAQGADGGVVAASRDGLTTGFKTPGGNDFLYFSANHVGATAWLALAQLSVNPFTLASTSVTFTAGDFNEDGIVDARDYEMWRRSFGHLVFPGSGADGDGDGFVTGADYTVWRDQLGQASRVGESARLGSPHSPGVLPEPPACLATVAAIAAMAAVARSRARAKYGPRPS